MGAPCSARRRRQHPDIRCVLMSGMDVGDANDTGIDLFLPKPFPHGSEQMVLDIAA